MAGIRCPFCGEIMPDIRETHQTTNVNFVTGTTRGLPVFDRDFSWSIDLSKCPNCGNVQCIAIGNAPNVKENRVLVFPESNAVRFPEYIPQSIRNDYEEACAIYTKSPKAAATLARRCLQGMIRDFWGIKGKESLFKEIDAIKSHIPPMQWNAIDAVRKIGNIGAHMEKDVNLIIDVDAGESEKLLRLIELLMEKWYISRYDEERLYESIAGAAARKAVLKHTGH